MDDLKNFFLLLAKVAGVLMCLVALILTANAVWVGVASTSLM